MSRQIRRLSESIWRTKQINSVMAEKATNTKDLAQLLNLAFAQLIKNWNAVAPGQLVKRGGMKLRHAILAITGGVLFEHFYNYVFIVGYGTTVAAVDIVALTTIEIKTNFSETAPVSGETYGNYFALGSGGTEKVGRISLTLAYDTQTANYNVGAELTQAASGASATILEDADGGATGILTLGNIDGVFETGEIMVDDGTVPGSAKADGVLTYVYTEIAAAPKSKIVHITTTGSSSDAVLHTGQIRGDTSTYQASDVDDGSNPPFDTWTVGVVPGNGFKKYNKGAGILNAISSLGPQIVLGYEERRLGFRITIIGDSVSPRQNTDNDWENKQEGMSSIAVKTSVGVVFITKSGFKALIAGGETNVPFSEIVLDISADIDDDYWKDVDLERSKIIEDTKRKLIYFIIRKDSDTNNVIWAWHTKNKTLVQYSQMNLDGVAKIGTDIYGLSSTNGNIFELFIGSDDNGLPIPTDYVQEIPTNSSRNKFDLGYFLIQALLAQDSTHFVDFSYYDLFGVFKPNKKQLKMLGTIPLEVMKGWGTASFGTSGFGIGKAGKMLGARPYQKDNVGIKEFTRLLIRLRSNDKFPARINLFTGDIIDRGQVVVANNLLDNT